MIPGPPPALAGFEWVRALGAGGFADVHLFRQLSPQREVAVKVQRGSGAGPSQQALIAEANALAKVSGHPGVVSLYSVGMTDDGRAYLAMEFCPVANISEQVRQQPMAVAVALELLVQISAAVETLHRQGLVHRDLKPANLMLTRWSRPVLADFGATVPIGVMTPGAGGFTLLWAAPEQQQGAPAHPSQDVWALGATAWTLLNGYSPFEEPRGDNSAAAVATRVQAGRLPALARPDVPDELAQVLRSAMRLDPAARTPSALAFAEGLRAVQDLMRLSPTPMLLQSGNLGDGPAAVDDNRTRVRPITTLDPDAETGFEFSGPPAEDLDVTLPPSSAVASARPVPVAEKPTGLRGWVVALLLALVALTTGGVVAGVLLGDGASQSKVTASQEPVPVDPIKVPPAPVTGLRGEVSKGKVYWSWKASTEPNVNYVFTITRPGRDPYTTSANVNSVNYALVKGENCIEVTVVTKDGRESNPTESCIKV